MTIRSAVVPLAVLATLAVAATGAAAQSNCEWYAKTAVRQQQINEEKRCGFIGDAWHKDLAAHMKWCAGVAPDFWKSEAQKRNQQLDACPKK